MHLPGLLLRSVQLRLAYLHVRDLDGKQNFTTVPAKLVKDVPSCEPQLTVIPVQHEV